MIDVADVLRHRFHFMRKRVAGRQELVGHHALACPFGVTFHGNRPIFQPWRVAECEKIRPPDPRKGHRRRPVMLPAIQEGQVGFASIAATARETALLYYYY